MRIRKPLYILALLVSLVPVVLFLLDYHYGVVEKFPHILHDLKPGVSVLIAGSSGKTIPLAKEKRMYYSENWQYAVLSLKLVCDFWLLESVEVRIFGIPEVAIGDSFFQLDEEKGKLLRSVRVQIRDPETTFTIEHDELEEYQSFLLEVVPRRLAGGQTLVSGYQALFPYGDMAWAKQWVFSISPGDRKNLVVPISLGPILEISVDSGNFRPSTGTDPWDWVVFSHSFFEDRESSIPIVRGALSGTGTFLLPLPIRELGNEIFVELERGFLAARKEPIRLRPGLNRYPKLSTPPYGDLEIHLNIDDADISPGGGLFALLLPNDGFPTIQDEFFESEPVQVVDPSGKAVFPELPVGEHTILVFECAHGGDLFPNNEPALAWGKASVNAGEVSHLNLDLWEPSGSVIGQLVPSMGKLPSFANILSQEGIPIGLIPLRDGEFKMRVVPDRKVALWAKVDMADGIRQIWHGVIPSQGGITSIQIFPGTSELMIPATEGIHGGFDIRLSGSEIPLGLYWHGVELFDVKSPFSIPSSSARFGYRVIGLPTGLYLGQLYSPSRKVLADWTLECR